MEKNSKSPGVTDVLTPFKGLTHTGKNDKIMAALHSGENYNDTAKQVVMVYANSDAGMIFLGGVGAASTAKANATSMASRKTEINPVDLLEREDRTANLNLSQRIGDKGNLGVSLSGYGKNKSIMFSGNYAVGKGNVFFATGDGIVAGFDQNILGKDIKMVYDSSTHQAAFAGGFKPVRNTSVDVGIDNVLKPTNIFLNARYDGKNIGAMVSIDNVLSPTNVSVATKINVNDLSTFVGYSHSLFGPDRTIAGVTYKIGDVQIMVDASAAGRKVEGYDIGLISPILCLTYGKDASGGDRVALAAGFNW